MPQPSNGITPEIIRDAMPPYRLDQDLLTATFAAIAPPPADTPTAQRHARITRLISEVTALRPADAAQARLATQILILREFSNTLIARAQTEDLQINQLCRIARSSADLQRSANTLERSLARHQQKPVPFFGTVIQDEVDIPALDATWTHPAPAHPPAAHQPAPPTQNTTPPIPMAAPPPAPIPPTRYTAPPPIPNPAPPPPPARVQPPAPASAPPATAATPPPAPTPKQPPAPTPASAPRTPTAERNTTRPASSDPATQWTITQLDSGPGWTREILRHRDAPKEATR